MRKYCLGKGNICICDSSTSVLPTLEPTICILPHTSLKQWGVTHAHAHAYTHKHITFLLHIQVSLLRWGHIHLRCSYFMINLQIENFENSFSISTFVSLACVLACLVMSSVRQVISTNFQHECINAKTMSCNMRQWKQQIINHTRVLFPCADKSPIDDRSLLSCP